MNWWHWSNTEISPLSNISVNRANCMVPNKKRRNFYVPMRTQSGHHNTWDTCELLSYHHWTLVKLYAQCVLSGLCAIYFATRKSYWPRQDDQPVPNREGAETLMGSRVRGKLRVFRNKENRKLERKQDQLNGSIRVRVEWRGQFINWLENIFITLMRGDLGNFQWQEQRDSTRSKGAGCRLSQDSEHRSRESKQSLLWALHWGNTAISTQKNPVYRA